MACPGSMNVPCLPPSATRWLPWNAPRMPRGWLGSSRTGGVIMYHMTLHYYTTMTTTYYNRNYVLKQWRDKATKVRTWESQNWRNIGLKCSGFVVLFRSQALTSFEFDARHSGSPFLSPRSDHESESCMTSTLHDFEPKKPLSRKSWIKQHDRTTPTTIGFSGWQVFFTLKWLQQAVASKHAEINGEIFRETFRLRPLSTQDHTRQSAWCCDNVTNPGDV